MMEDAEKLKELEADFERARLALDTFKNGRRVVMSQDQVACFVLSNPCLADEVKKHAMWDSGGYGAKAPKIDYPRGVFVPMKHLIETLLIAQEIFPRVSHVQICVMENKPLELMWLEGCIGSASDKPQRAYIAPRIRA